MLNVKFHLHRYSLNFEPVQYGRLFVRTISKCYLSNKLSSILQSRNVRNRRFGCAVLVVGSIAQNFNNFIYLTKFSLNKFIGIFIVQTTLFFTDFFLCGQLLLAPSNKDITEPFLTVHLNFKLKYLLKNVLLLWKEVQKVCCYFRKQIAKKVSCVNFAASSMVHVI